MVTLSLPSALFIFYFLSAQLVSGSYPRAQNVTWKSTNFKTILTWEPKPSSDYSYTVEFSVVGGDKQRDPHCIRSSMTVCDLSSSLTHLHAYYTADVLSGPPLGATSDLIEFPYTSSPRFCPYKDRVNKELNGVHAQSNFSGEVSQAAYEEAFSEFLADIGKPDFRLEVSEDKKKTTLYVKDPLTALFKNGNQLNIREIFSDELQYKVIYRKNKSTGKKVYNSKASVIELTDLDQGESYCFSVQAYIPSRSIDKQLGELSRTQCSNDDSGSIFEVYSVGVIASAIFLILLLIGLIIAITVVCCKRRKKALKSGKEGFPLQGV